MSIRLEIEVPSDIVLNDHAGRYLERAMSALGFSRASAVRSTARELMASTVAAEPVEKLAAAIEEEVVRHEAEEPKRQRGQAAPGRSRRTKAEIAEDEAADARDAAARQQDGEAEQAQISSGGERTGPEDDPETEAQDAADEAAEAAANAGATKTLTHDDVRAALGAYVKKFGMPAAQEDGPKVIALMFGKDKGKVSDIPDTQADLGKAVAGIEEMSAKNPFKREAV